MADAESRSHAAHKKSLEAASEAKRLQPLEGKVSKLEEQLAGSKADAHRCTPLTSASSQRSGAELAVLIHPTASMLLLEPGHA